jgi:hypothetical protein
VFLSNGASCHGALRWWTSRGPCSAAIPAILRFLSIQFPHASRGGWRSWRLRLSGPPTYRGGVQGDIRQAATEILNAVDKDALTFRALTVRLTAGYGATYHHVAGRNGGATGKRGWLWSFHLQSRRRLRTGRAFGFRRRNGTSPPRAPHRHARPVAPISSQAPDTRRG